MPLRCCREVRASYNRMVCGVEAGCGGTVVVVNNENRWICGVDCSAEVGELRFGGMKTAVRGVVLSDGCCVRVVFRVAY